MADRTIGRGPTECLTAPELEELAASDDRPHAHLESCSACTAAVAGLREDLALLSGVREAMGTDAGVLPPSQPGGLAADSFDGYEIGREIHRGGQGVVYEAVQTSTRRRVALKVLHGGAFATPRQRLRFEREVELAADLQHSNIVTVFGSGIAGGQPYYAMELVDGLPLDRWLAATPLASRKDARPLVQLFARICDAVSYAQRRGIIHRDLKPDNILVDSAGEPHLLDFGLAKLDSRLLDGARADAATEAAHLTMSGEFLGTVAYASPEQVRGDPQAIDVRTDVYSLGVMLYEALTGAFPYPVDAHISQVLRHIAERAPVQPRSLQPWIDGELETILLQALAKDPDRRYQSAEHLLRDLRAYLEGRPIDARRDSIWYLLRKAFGRHRLVVTAIASGLAVLVLSFVLVLHFWRQAVQEGSRAERSAYVANVAAADSALRMHDVVGARRHLGAAPHGLRGWEWRHLAGRCDGSLEALEHGAPVHGIAWSTSPPVLASGAWDGTVKVWRPNTGGEPRVLATGAPVKALALSRDGSRLAIARTDGSVELLDSSKGTPLLRLGDSTCPTTCVAFSPDGGKLAVGRGGKSEEVAGVQVHDLSSGDLLFDAMPEDYICTVAWSAEGETLAVGDSKGVCLLDASSGTELARAERGIAVLALAFHPTDAVIVLGTRDGGVELLAAGDLASIDQLHGHTLDVHAVAFSPDGELLASASRDKTVRLWDWRNARHTRVLLGHDWQVGALAFERDGTRLASGSWDGSIRLWDPSARTSKHTLRGHEQKISSLMFDPAGERLVSSSWDGTARLWDAGNGACLGVLAAHQEPLSAAVFDPAGRMLATGAWDATVRLWDAATLEPLGTLEGHSHHVHSLAWSPDGTLLASGSRDHTIRLWDPARRELVAVLEGHDDHVHGVAFDPTGRWLASSGHTSLRIWDVARREQVRRFDRAIVQDDFSLAFHPTLSLIAAGSDFRTVTVWDFAAGAVHAVLRGHTDEIHSAAFSPAGDRLVTVSLDGGVLLWDTVSWAQLASLHGHDAFVSTVAWSPDGSSLAAGQVDGAIELWRERVSW